MAQVKAVDLVVQQGGAQTSALARLPAKATTRSLALQGGVAVAGLGVVTLALVPMFGLWLTSLLLAMGTLLVLVGVVRRGGVEGPPELAAPRVDPHVLAERCRRIKAILRSGSGPYTFERLVQESRWTKAAVLSTLLHMKDRGEIVEDLDLDSGEWIYSLADPIDGPSSVTSPMLEEMKALVGDPERTG